MNLEPQAALETAVRNSIRSALGYGPADCERTFDGRPHPRAGDVFVAVWSGGRKQNGKAGRTALDQVFTVSVTVTRRTTQPFDRSVKHRDDVEARANAIVALAQNANWGWDIVNAANALAGYRNAGLVDDAGIVGFCEALCWESLEDARIVDGSHFHADPDRACGVAQTARFGRARRIQALPTAS